MTALDDTPDTARAADLDCAREAWRTFPWQDRGSFGAFAVNFLRERGIELVPASEPLGCGEAPIPLYAGEWAPPAGPLAAAFNDLVESAHIKQALKMDLPQVADLLAALAERDLHWTAGESGQCGTLREGTPEPPDLHVVFDCFRGAWQRADERAKAEGCLDARWFGPHGLTSTWAKLCRTGDPLTPAGGIAPPMRDKP